MRYPGDPGFSGNCQECLLGVGPGRKAVGAGGEIPFFPWLRDSPEEVERFIPTSALWLREASKAPSRGKNRAWPGKNSWEGSRAQNSPCCASREQGCAWGREQGKETDQGDRFQLRSALGDGETILCFRVPGQPQEDVHSSRPASLWRLLSSWGCRGVRVLRG